MILVKGWRQLVGNIYACKDLIGNIYLSNNPWDYDDVEVVEIQKADIKCIIKILKANIDE